MSTDPFPSPETVADQLACSRSACESPGDCWTRGGCLLRYRSDPKGRPRIRDSKAMRRKVSRDRECRVPDCGEPATDPHHIVYRSLGGDDVEENICGICRMHHDILHFSAGDDYWETRHGLGAAFHDNEVEYAISRLGVEEGSSFLRRAYGVPQERLDALLESPPAT